MPKKFKNYVQTKLTKEQQRRASACMSRYASHESDKKKLTAKCLSMARDNRLTENGTYKKKK
tara:strand:- start:5056 stop:5241 length:186 start_codon:yes stop_codon:yes gene_type:complete